MGMQAQSALPRQGARSLLLLMAGALLLLSLACAHVPIEPLSPSAPLAALSGSWKGRHDPRQAGECIYGGGAATLTLTLVVLEDGTASGSVGGDPLTGTILRGGQVRFERTGQSSCQGAGHTWKSSYKGTVGVQKGRTVMRFSGLETWCPPECAFHVSYSFQKED